MSTVFDVPEILTLSALDKADHVVAMPPGIPAWTVSDPSASITPAADGLSAVLLGALSGSKDIALLPGAAVKLVINEPAA